MVSGIVAALGFGEAGIAASSIAAWMMSLYSGFVPAGSLVSILQSVGAFALSSKPLPSVIISDLIIFCSSS
ncbi:hypothetical protein C1645_764126 [Glomus cerebriforme]|uniref:Uncharacterized protein n=1 Tax=Glomus cerebriforme TaxID=658196 RepID=A0A397T7D7_9GLOM|nr:hypothetical protein C1645_764126 [Glomus cerebriforme]